MSVVQYIFYISIYSSYFQQKDQCRGPLRTPRLKYLDLIDIQLETLALVQKDTRMERPTCVLTHTSTGSDHVCISVTAFFPVSTYTNAFAITQLCGILCAPWNGLILDRHKGKPREAGQIGKHKHT